MIVDRPFYLVVNSEARLDAGLSLLVRPHCLDGPGVWIRSWEAVLVFLQLYRYFRVTKGRFSGICCVCISYREKLFKSVGIKDILV